MSSTPRDTPSKRDTPEPTSPGRPDDANSRQQTHENQNSQTGSPELDKQATRRTGTPAVAPKPAEAK